jgi:hypothetical protein
MHPAQPLTGGRVLSATFIYKVVEIGTTSGQINVVRDSDD